MNEITEGLVLSAAGSLRLCVRTHFRMLVCLFFWLFSAHRFSPLFIASLRSFSLQLFVQK